MNIDTKDKELTDEQLWELCIEEEKRKRVIESNYRDKGLDYDYERFIWEKWNPNNF